MGPGGAGNSSNCRDNVEYKRIQASSQDRATVSPVERGLRRLFWPAKGQRPQIVNAADGIRAALGCA